MIIVILHLFLFAVATVVAKVAEGQYIINDADTAMIVAIFLPLGIIVWIGALWVADKINHYLRM